MSWLFSQALVEEYLGANYLDGEQSVQLNGNNIQQAYCALDKMTGFLKVSQSGMMFKPLTESLGEELLMSFLGDFHARTLAQQEGGGELLQAEVQCGNTWRELLAKYNPNTALWKTAQCSLIEDLEQSLEIWPRWGSMRNGECYRQPMLAQTTSETEFGLSEQTWPTPDANCGQRGTQPNWTPKRKSGHSAQYTINQAVRDRFPTPQASDNRDRGNMSSPSVKRRLKIGKQVSLGQSVSETSGKLNPEWVEWLMGWPLGWTDLKPLETDKSHFVQQQHGNY